MTTPFSLNNWYANTPLGQEVARLEFEQIQAIWPLTGGQNLLQLGDNRLIDQINDPHLQHRMACCPPPLSIIDANHTPLTIADYLTLPFPSESIDAILLPHILEYEPDPSPIVNETWRTLAPGGHLFILSFNPWSLWGLWRLLGKTVPGDGHFHSADKLSLILEPLGAEKIIQKSFFFAPPKEQKVFPSSSGLEKIFRLLFPNMGGIYLLVFKKMVLPLTPQKTAWQWSTILPTGKGIPEPSTRQHHD